MFVEVRLKDKYWIEIVGMCENRSHRLRGEVRADDTLCILV